MYELVERKCTCGQMFKVLSSSTQQHHSEKCRLEDPNYVAPVIVKPKSNIAKIVKSIDNGAVLKVVAQTKEAQTEFYKAEREKDFEDPKLKWEKAIEEARALAGSMKAARLKIAELALSVCEVKCGGNWREFARIYTIKNFANDIGVHPKTLHQWIRIKKNIHDQLPEGVWVEDWALAVRVDHSIGAKASKDKVVKSYEKEKARNKPMRRLRTVRKSVDNFVFLLTKKEVLAKCPKEDLKEALESVTVLKKALEKSLGYKRSGGTYENTKGASAS